MNFKLIIKDKCPACNRAQKQLFKIKGKHPQISFDIIHIEDFKDATIFITPALFKDDELISYGDLQEEKIYSMIN